VAAGFAQRLRLAFFFFFGYRSFFVIFVAFVAELCVALRGPRVGGVCAETAPNTLLERGRNCQYPRSEAKVNNRSKSLTQLRRCG
jgi:hypothetical protein